MGDFDAQQGALAHVAHPLLELVRRLTGLQAAFLTRIDGVARRQLVVAAADSDPAVPTGMPIRVAVPVVDGDDRLLGMLCGAGREVTPVDPEALQGVRLVAAALAHQMGAEDDLRSARIRAADAEMDSRAAHVQADDLARTLRRLQVLAMTDPLTGLANRRAFMDRWEEELARAGRHGHPIAVLLLDVDEFKAVNDALGHHSGDDVLVAVAATLRSLARAGDVAARLGGDEFAIVAPHADATGAEGLARRLVEELGRACGDVAPECTVSAGVAAAPGTPPHQLLEAADRALFRAKRAGRQRVEVWEGELTARDVPACGAPPLGRRLGGEDMAELWGRSGDDVREAV